MNKGMDNEQLMCLIDSAVEHLSQEMPEEKDYNGYMPYTDLKRMHSLMANTPMPNLMAMLYIKCMKEDRMQEVIDSMLLRESNDTKMTEKSVEIELNSTCPGSVFNSGLEVIISMQEENQKRIDEALVGFDQEWKEDDIGVFLKWKCNDQESAQLIQEQLQPMIEGVSEMKEGMHQMLIQLLAPMLGLPEDSPLTDFLKNVEEHLEMKIQASGDQLLLSVRVNWNELRQLVAFIRKQQARFVGHDNKLHMIFNINSLLGAKDLVDHLGNIRAFIEANATNPKTNFKANMQIKLFKHILNRLCVGDGITNRVKEQIENGYTKGVARKAVDLFCSGLNKLRLSFQYGKDAVEYSEDIQHIHNQLKKSKTLELLPDGNQILLSLKNVVEMTGMEEQLEMIMTNCSFENTLMLNLGVLQIKIDMKTNGLAEVYQLAKNTEIQE